ncbi:EamA family transporter [Rhizobiales bacterium RZME27]|uniref:EamA family transporter n=2 Tax=Endobacterium cereale TaxID=2663029 RepID=A0A6A8A7A4_9HYPH|nr:EamA family transporter [Endobacterium cereale]
MVLAMAMFICNDALVKAASTQISIAQIMFVRGAMTLVLVFLIARHLGALPTRRMLTDRTMLLRVFFEIGATLTYLTALSRIPFANASSILQSLPLAVTLGAALFLGEPVGWRRWVAILVGFIGVLVILKPGPSGFVPDALFAVVAVFFTAGRDLVTKRVDPTIPSISVSLFTTTAITSLGACLIVPMGGWRPLDADMFGLLALAALAVLVAYQCIILAMRNGEISFVAPFRYTSLIWALGIGIVFFGEIPTNSMMIGIVLVIGSGLYTFYRESRRRQVTAGETDPAPPA